MDNFKNWINYIEYQYNFYRKLSLSKRSEKYFPWDQITNNKNMRQVIKDILINLKVIGDKKYYWFDNNKENLFKTREIFQDDISKKSFDSTIILRLVGHNKYFYPFINHINYIEVVKSSKFINNNFPNYYLSSNLMQYNCAINIEGAVSPVNIIATEGWVDFQNTFSQYITSFIDEKFIPKKGDVVFDCGSCIGETSVLMGALVGGSGQVHMFDPVPLHIRFCEYQAKSNPDIKHIFFPVEFAVSDVSSTSYNDVDKKLVISPGRLATENFSKISIDDYVEKNKINQLNYIKMDIEGSEGSALIGASNSIKKFTPKLAISAYHKFDDFWTIPNIIKSLNPDYKIYFSHHSPVNWESVIYAG